MYDLGILYANLGMMKQAVSVLSTAVKLNDNHSSAGDAKRVLEAIHQRQLTTKPTQESMNMGKGT
jgi:hypothetical protein